MKKCWLSIWLIDLPSIYILEPFSSGLHRNIVNSPPSVCLYLEFLHFWMNLIRISPCMVYQKQTNKTTPTTNTKTFFNLNSLANTTLVCPSQSKFLKVLSIIFVSISWSHTILFLPAICHWPWSHTGYQCLYIAKYGHFSAILLDFVDVSDTAGIFFS